MHPLAPKELERILKAHGFVLSRERGSHRIYRHPETGSIVPIPFHGKSKPLPIGTFMAIVKQSKLPKDVFK
ncbi:MAG: type II toxin-antitoxin system HicA family toxin [Patescibacteria group bacterium]